MLRQWLWVAATTVIATTGPLACGRPADAASADGRPADAAPATGPVRLAITPAAGYTVLSVIAEPGVKVNARLKPALELADGSVLRFDSPSITPDSAYFTVPPTAELTGRHTAVHGTLRASVCSTGEQICRSVVVPI